MIDPHRIFIYLPVTVMKVNSNQGKFYKFINIQLELLRMAQDANTVPNPDVIVPEGNFNAGKTIFQDLCQSCHKMRGDGQGEQAPSLKGLIGRRAGFTKYNSSQSLKKSNIIWSKEHLFLYLRNPALYIKGIKQAFLKSFLTIEDTQERADLIQYITDYKK